MNILIIGANGMLGSAFVAQLQKTAHSLLTPSKQALNITKPIQIEQYFSRHKIDLILHCGAYTDVERAESEEELVFRTNMEGLQHLLQQNIPLIHFSTDYVFDQSQAQSPNGILEQTDQRALNVYGQSKQVAEKILETHQGNWWNIRTSWLYGNNGRNFVDTMKKKLLKEESVDVIDDQIGRPTNTKDLASFVIIHFIDKTLPSGHYHLQNEGKPISWYGITTFIQSTLQTNGTINAIQSADYPTKAKRPNWSVLQNTKLPAMPNWEESLRKHIETPSSKKGELADTELRFKGENY